MNDAALLRVEDLSVAYGAIPAVESVRFTIAPGRCLGVVGESGAGKTQAFLALMGLLPAQGARRGPGATRRRRPARAGRRGTARPAGRNDLPGPHDLADAAHANRRSDRLSPW
jgi:ABC-type glutathione transport system ATPase component